MPEKRGRMKKPSRRYVFVLLAVAVVTAHKLLFAPLIQVESPFLLFPVALVLSVWVGGRVSGLLATGLAIISVDYFFASPAYAFGIVSPGDAVRLGVSWRRGF